MKINRRLALSLTLLMFSLFPVIGIVYNHLGSQLDSTCVALDVNKDQILFWDADNDGYGRPNSKVGLDDQTLDCSSPGQHWADNGDDCNDDFGTIFPAAPEPCDMIDNDCNGWADNVKDCDVDGFTADDCDPWNATVNPGAVEIPYNGLDEDCNGYDLADVDCDGFSAPLDCDDHDPNLYPGHGC